MFGVIKNRYRSFAVSKKINLFVLLITVISTTVMGIFSYWSFRNTSLQIVGDGAMKIAESAAAGIDGDKIRNYDKTNKTDADYTKLAALLSNIKKNVGADFIYIITDAGNEKYKYIAEGHIDGRNDDISKLGETDDKSIFSAEADKALETGKATYTNIYSSGTYGSIISGFMPVKTAKVRRLRLWALILTLILY